MTAEASLPEPDRVAGHPHPRETARLIGQDAAERTVLGAWADGRIHHAWLLRGPRGAGKATLAYRVARALLADGPTGETGLFGAPEPPATLDAPEGCPVQALIEAGAEPRLFVLRRELAEARSSDAKPRLRTQITVDQVRRLKAFIQLTAADGGWRVVIADPIDEANAAAANALLKVLEEPPKRIALLLVSHAPAGLLPTIRSRCRALDLGPLGPTDLALALEQAGLPVPADQAAAVATLASGSVGAALRLVDAGGVQLYGRLIKAFGQGRAIDRQAMVALAEAVSARGSEVTYALTVELLLTLLARLARTAASGTLPGETLEAESALAGQIARHPGQAVLWAEAVGRIAAATAHARAVNLDPGQTIMDTFLDLDLTLARANPAGTAP